MMRKPLFLLLLLLNAAQLLSQINATADKVLYLNLTKVGPFSLSKNEHANAAGLPIGGGFSSKMNRDWIFDINLQYGILGNALTTRYARKEWFDVQLGFQKSLYQFLEDKLSVRSNFGFGYYNLQTLKKASFGSEIRGLSYGPYLHLGCVLNYDISKRVTLYNKVQVRASAMTNASSYNTTFFNGNAVSDMFYKRTDLDFAIVPFEFGISFNFYSADDP